MLPLFINQAPVAIALLDRDLRYVAASPRWRVDYGLGDQPLAGRCHYDVFPDIPAEWKAVHQRCLAGASEHRDDARFVRADGVSQWIRWDIQPWRADDGAVLGIVIFSEDITTRKETELALRDNEQRLRLALDASAAGIWWQDLRTGAVDLDGRSREIFGIAPADVIGPETLVARIDERDVAAVQERLARVQQPHGFNDWDVEFRVRHPDGGIVWVHGIGRAERDDAGRATRFTGINLDITARKAAEMALAEVRDAERESANELRMLLTTASQGILTIDTSGRIISANPAMAAMFGWGADELVSQTLSVLIPEELHAAHARAHAQYWAAPRSRPMGIGLDLRGRRKDGTTFPVEISLNYVETVHGGRAIAFVTDITERIRSIAVERDSRQRLAMALEAASAGAWSWDVAADTLSMDDTVAQQVMAVGNRPFSRLEFLARVDPRDRPTWEAAWTSMRRPDGPDKWSIEYRLLSTDAETVWRQSIGRAERGESGQLRRVAGISVDITARKAAEIALTRAHHALQDRAAELETRTAQLSRLASELTLAEQHAREQLAKALHDHLQQLLFSSRLKLDRAHKKFTDRPADAPELVERARHDLDEAIAAARSLAVELFPPMLHDGGLPAALTWLAGRMEHRYGLQIEVDADADANPERRDVRTLVFESVRELLFNVVKHAHADRVVLTLAKADGDDLRITVADRGVGFNPGAALHRAGGGVGLGLFGIRERLALFGGRLEVRSAPGAGADFTLLIPRTAARAAAATTAGSGQVRHVREPERPGTPRCGC